MLVFLSGGRLGNQIFQYMFLTSIAEKNERIFCFDMKMFFDTFDFDKNRIWHNSNRYISYFFQKFVIPVVIKPLCKVRLISFIEQKKDANLRPLPEWNETTGLMPFIRYVNNDYFQSELFIGNNHLPRSNLCIKEEYLKEARHLIGKIPEYYTKVFIHVRRGDYRNVSFLGEKGIDLPESYFENAIGYIRRKVDNPFFVFLSDDPSYVRDIFQGVEPKIISEHSMQVDLGIMSLCEAGIMSNSTFSWWGAYFIDHKRIIIAPKYWYGWKQQVESHPGIQPSFSIILDI